MTEPLTDTDLVAAADPVTAPETLGRIASERPDLHAALAANPSSYDELLDWLFATGDTAVRAVIHERRGTTPVLDEVPPVPRAPLGRGSWTLIGLVIGFVIGGVLSALLVLLVLPGLFGSL